MGFTKRFFDQWDWDEFEKELQDKRDAADDDEKKQVEEEIYRRNFIINSKGALPSGTMGGDNLQGSGSPVGDENSHSVRKRLLPSRVEHPTEKVLPKDERQKKQQGVLGNLTPKPTKFTGDAPVQTFQGAKRQADSALYCTNCGNTLKTTAKFCGSCGTRTA